MRLRSLDSVRGIAALIVLFYHASLVFPPSPATAWLQVFPIRLLVAGPVAVVLFFVLSGLVLAGTFINRDGEHPFPYAVKRTIRIYTPFAAAIAGSIVLKVLFDHGPVVGASDWLNHATWDEPIGRRMLAATMAMTGTDTRLNNPMWSLVHELRISLAFPALVWLMKRDWRVGLLATGAGGAICVKMLAHVPSGSVTANLLQTGSYVILFAFGIAIAIHSGALRAWAARQTSAVHLALWAAALTVLCFGPEDTAHVSRLGEYGLLVADGMAAALILLLAVVEGRALVMLMGRIPLFLGDISFSLYLVHIPLIASAVHGLGPQVPLWARAGIGAAASIPVAFIFHRYVEKKSAVASRVVGDYIARSIYAGGRRR